MGTVASRGNNNTPLLNLCKERKELIRAARDARYHLASSHLLYLKSLLDFSKALNQFVHKDLIVIPYSDDDSSSSDLICSTSDSDESDSDDSDSDSESFVCDDGSQAAPAGSDKNDQNQTKPVCGDETCGSSNNVQDFMEKPKEGLGFFEEESASVPVEDEMRGTQNFSCNENNIFRGHDILGLYGTEDNTTQTIFIEPEQHRDEFQGDGLREIREREGIPDLESETDHESLVRKKQKKKKKKKSVKESSSSASEINDKRDIEANTSNAQQVVADEADESNETCVQETERTQENVVEEVTRSDDEGYESSSSSFSESSGSSLTDLRNIVEKTKCICEKIVSNSEVSEFLEVTRVVHHQPLGSQFKGFASRVLLGGTSEKSMRIMLKARRGLRADDLPGSLCMTLEKLYMWEKKLYTEVTLEEKLRVSYDKAYKILTHLDQTGAESNDIYEAENVVKLELSKINVSVKMVESVSMRIHKIRDEELLFQVVKIINGFKQMWRFLAKCHHKQFRAISRSMSCVHIVGNGSRSRKATQQVEEEIRRYRESLRGYIDAHRGFVRLLNEWLKRNIMEEEEEEEEEDVTQIDDAPEIFRICSEWLREIVNVDEIKVLSAVEEMRLRFRGLGLKQVEEEKQRMRTERLYKELEKKTKELEEIWGTPVVFPANGSSQAVNMMVGPELLSLRESVTQEREKHEIIARELNDAVSVSLQESLVPVFEALEEFCFANFKAYQNISIVPS